MVPSFHDPVFRITYVLEIERLGILLRTGEPKCEYPGLAHLHPYTNGIGRPQITAALPCDGGIELIAGEGHAIRDRAALDNLAILIQQAHADKAAASTPRTASQSRPLMFGLRQS